ncbi:Saf4/Yju2 family protein [Sporobolomyces koalae]|uniref:Saf4/Yju2 family protein n=1 Tax=Sporobolomyces koalae TaxID=500713 RepID=UPI00317261BF
MQGFNKYYPPDYDPSQGSLNKRAGKHALGDRARKLDQGILIVRFELPYNIWCGHCNAHIGQGVRYNAEKKKVGMYYSSTIWSFRCKCHLCSGWFEIRTDPQNTRYVVHEGARQKYEEWDPEENGQMVIDNSASTSTAPPDPFASVEKNLTQKTKALSESERLSAMYEHNSSHWDDPYLSSSLLRNSFRKKKKTILASEAKAEQVRDKFGLGDRVAIESLRTPARQEDRELEDSEWRAVQKEKQDREVERKRKREREEDQVVGWDLSSSKSRERARARVRERDRARSSATTTTSTPSSRKMAPLPSRSLKSRTIASSASSAASPAAKALHDKLALATALKNDPFSNAGGSGPSARTASSSSLAGVQLVRKKSVSK